MRIVLLGPPASDKGTQGRRIVDVLDLEYLSTGALLREAVREADALGLSARPILDKGGYLPDDFHEAQGKLFRVPATDSRDMTTSLILKHIKSLAASISDAKDSP